MIYYLGEEMFREFGFPYIQDKLASAEPVPNYLADENGMAELRKVLFFVQQDNYYPDFHDKAAYLLTSIAASQYFSNGNKRLAVVTLLLFLTLNEAEVIMDSEELFRELLKIVFPNCKWEDNKSIRGRHSLFLYNLAIVLGDRTKWDTNDFGVVKQKVSILFKHLYKREIIAGES